MIRKHTLIGAAGAGALVFAVVGPASAAGELSASVTYDCSGISVPATYSIDAPAVSSIVAGQTLRLNSTGTFHLDTATSAAAPALLGATTTQVGGTITTTAGGRGVGLNLTIARTLLKNEVDLSTTAPSTGKVLVKSKAAGTYTLKLADIGSAKIQGYDASNAKTGFVQFPDGAAFGPCVNPNTTTTIMNGADPATIKVTKDASKVTVAAAYSKAMKKTTATAKVKGKTFGLTGTGKVTFKLKKGTHTLATVKGVKLNSKGVARAVFKKALRHGKYKVVASYGGSAGLKSGSGTDAFSVS
jgi:hypothetical protein